MKKISGFLSKDFSSAPIPSSILWLIFLSVLLFIMSLPMRTDAAPLGKNTGEINAPIADGAGLLNKTDLRRLTEKIRSVEERHGIRIGIVAQSAVNGHVGKAANALLDAGYSDGENGGIVLLISMGSRDWYISTNNPMRQRITDDDGIPYIRDQILPRLSDGDYAGAFEEYIDTVDSMLSYYEKEGIPYNPMDEFSPLALLVAIAGAIGCGGFVRASMIAGMKNVRHAAEAEAYLVRDSVKPGASADRFLYMNVSRTSKHEDRDSMDTSGRDSSHGGGGGKF